MPDRRDKPRACRRDDRRHLATLAGVKAPTISAVATNARSAAAVEASVHWRGSSSQIFALAARLLTIIATHHHFTGAAIAVRRGHIFNEQKLLFSPMIAQGR